MKTLKTLNVIKYGLVGLMLMFSHQAWSNDFFDDSFGNFQEELELARDDKKLGVFIFFEMDDCPFCHRMKETILKEPDVIDYFHQFFKVYRFDIEGASPVTDFDGTDYNTGKEMAERKYRVRATPVMMMFDLDGQPMARYTGPTHTKEEFLLFGRYVVEGHYQTMPFNRFKRTQD
ncbi:thioredoxin fold domain-containing protein [Thiomicrospira sp. R3]|uniref:thioredoxin family protein n=1 Tax=Thiomicrospira sp. R3 TaxID=3035472 RepID=UPI00259AEF74|nr:thioredoxin fold domain-containing protein [Thiomicrospira sp. R3]WFE68730.1 thioredoxin fold domain-containing protein [Thiomicrospira sp. R3]